MLNSPQDLGGWPTLLPQVTFAGCLTMTLWATPGSKPSLHFDDRRRSGEGVTLVVPAATCSTQTPP